MKGGTYTKTLPKIQVRGIFRIRDIRKNVLSKLIEISMESETPCRCSSGEAPTWQTETNRKISLRRSVSVRFRSRERPRKEIFDFDRASNETRAKKWKRGERKGKEGNVSLLSSPPPPRSFTCAMFDSRSSLLNRTETLSTQSTEKSVTEFCYISVNLLFEKLINIKVILFLIHELFQEPIT